MTNDDTASSSPFKTLTPFERARAAFDRYCAMGAGELPEDPISKSQVLVARMRAGDSALESLAFLMRAVGELAECVDRDGIRNRKTVFSGARFVIRALVMICTAARLDFGELCKEL